MDPQPTNPIETTNPVTTPNPISPSISEPKPLKSFPWLLVIFAFLFFATLAAGIFFYLRVQTLQKQLTLAPNPTPFALVSPTPMQNSDSTSGWQTYNNSTYNFLFQYPNSLKVRSFAGSQLQLEEANSISLEDLNSNAYAQIIANNVTETGSELKKTNSINGYDTYSIIHPNGYPDDTTPFMVVEMHQGQKSVQFIFRNKIELDKLSNQILSSFQFTN